MWWHFTTYFLVAVFKASGLFRNHGTILILPLLPHSIMCMYASDPIVCVACKPKIMYRFQHFFTVFPSPCIGKS